MKIQKECIPCLLETTSGQVGLVSDDQDLQFKVLEEFLKFFASNFSGDITPSYYGTERIKMVERITSESDPYRELKIKANEVGEELLPYAKKIVERKNTEKERLKAAFKIAAAANSMEFENYEHSFELDSFQNDFEEIVKGDCGIDDSEELARRILDSDEILYLLDNCGEAILDKVLLGEIQETETDLIIAAKPDSIQEDVTVDIAEEIGLQEYGKIIPMGDTIGVFPDEIPDRFEGKLEESDLVISKGMANYETISEFEHELKDRLAYLLRAKCHPVARSLNAEKGDLIIKAR